MSLKDFTREAGKIIGLLGRFSMMDPATGARGADVGLDGRQFYVLGRGGALGDVDASVVSDHFHFFNPDFVTVVWNEAREKMDAAQAAQHYAEAVAEWGRDRFGDVGGLDQFCELANAVASAADVDGIPLFEGWRNVGLPDDAPGRAMQLIHVLREFRGSCHVRAIREVGLEPLQAVSVNSPHFAVVVFGSPAALADVDAYRSLVDKAEETTDDYVGPAFSVDRGD